MFVNTYQQEDVHDRPVTCRFVQYFTNRLITSQPTHWSGRRETRLDDVEFPVKSWKQWIKRVKNNRVL